MRVLAALLLAGSLAACGPTFARRPLELDVEGLSSLAERLVVKIFPEADGVGCGDVTLETVQALEAAHTESWARGETAQRRLMFDALDVPAITLVAYAEDAGGQAIQIACTQIDYLDIESPSRTLDLSGT